MHIAKVGKRPLGLGEAAGPVALERSHLREPARTVVADLAVLDVAFLDNKNTTNDDEQRPDVGEQLEVEGAPDAVFAEEQNNDAGGTEDNRRPTRFDLWHL